MKDVKAFISYARQDAAFVHLLEYILAVKGICCFLDRKLEPGKEFGPEIQRHIADAEVVIVPWTEAASSSHWVNQEIGYAIAKNVPVVPIITHKDNIPRGMVSSVQAYPLFEWSQPSKTVDGLLNAILKAKKRGRPHFIDMDQSLDLAIEGKIARTEFITKAITAALKTKANLCVYSLAAFSTFAISDDDAYRRISGHPKDYIEVLLKERAAFDKLVRRKNVELRMIFWPVRAYAGQLLELRFRNLLAWMHKSLEHNTEIKATINFACTEYVGHNTLIVTGHPETCFMLEGVKRGSTPGYEINVLTRDQTKIEKGISNFEAFFANAQVNGFTGESAVSEIKRLRNEQTLRCD